MAIDERASGIDDARADDLVDEAFAPGVELFDRMGGERRELEREELEDVERSRVILLEERVVAPVVFGAVDDAESDQEARPLVVAVDGQQRVVEVEEREVVDG